LFCCHFLLSYSRILNMNKGSLHTRSFRRIHLLVFKYRLTKNGFAGPRSFRDFRETGPGNEDFAIFVGRLPIDDFESLLICSDEPRGVRCDWCFPEHMHANFNFQQETHLSSRVTIAKIVFGLEKIFVRLHNAPTGGRSGSVKSPQPSSLPA